MDMKALEKAFDRKFVKKLQGFEYLEVHAVIQRLNDVDKDDWQFELLELMVDAEEIVQFGRLGRKSESGEWIWRSQCGSKKITYRTETVDGKKVAGPHVPENRVDYGNDFKAAASDCLKKCATLWGVGLYLYGEVEEDPREAVASSIERGEKEIADKLQCMPSDLRDQHFGDDGDNLAIKSLEELEGYLTYLYRQRDKDKQGTQPPDKEQSGSGEGNDTNEVPGDIIKLKNEASQAQAKALRDGVIKKLDVDAMRMKHFDSRTFPNDADKLTAFIKEISKL